MRKICLTLCIIILIIVIVLFGYKLKKDFSINLSDNYINNQYTLMHNKMIEYGSLIYENEQYLNEDTNIMISSMTLNEISIDYGYDISMFVNPETEELCDLEKSRIEFIVSDVFDKENIIYEFNPILICGDEIDGISDNLNEKLVSYISDAYEKELFNVDKNETSIITLGDLNDYGYDISMFINTRTGSKCNVDGTYGEFIINNITVDNELDYTLTTYIDCLD